MLRVPSQLPAMVADLAARAMRTLRDALRPSGVGSGFVVDLTRSRAELIAENALIRQQLVVASRAVKRPAFRVRERRLLVLLEGSFPSGGTPCSWSNPRPCCDGTGKDSDSSGVGNPARAVHASTGRSSSSGIATTSSVRSSTAS